MDFNLLTVMGVIITNGLMVMILDKKNFYMLCDFLFFFSPPFTKYLLLCTGEDEAPAKDDIIAKEMSELPHKKNKKHKKHKSKKKKRKKKGEKESSSESGAESDVEPPPPPKPVRNTRSRSEIICTFSRIHIDERIGYRIQTFNVILFLFFSIVKILYWPLVFNITLISAFSIKLV